MTMQKVLVMPSPPSCEKLVRQRMLPPHWAIVLTSNAARAPVTLYSGAYQNTGLSDSQKKRRFLKTVTPIGFVAGPVKPAAAMVAPLIACTGSAPLARKRRAEKLAAVQRLFAKPVPSTTPAPPAVMSKILPLAQAISLRVVPVWYSASVSTAPPRLPLKGFDPRRTFKPPASAYQLSIVMASVGSMPSKSSRVFQPVIGGRTGMGCVNGWAAIMIRWSRARRFGIY